MIPADDPRRRDAASMFTIRNSMRAKRRGWITAASASVDMNLNAGDSAPRRIIISWENPDGKVEDGDEADEGKTIEHDPAPSTKVLISSQPSDKAGGSADFCRSTTSERA